MNNISYSSNQFIWQVTLLLAIMHMSLISTRAYGQSGSRGNTSIFANAEMTIFADHSFLTGGNGIQAGIILTERTSGQIGYLNFSGNELITTGSDNSNYVDGYVRKYGTGQFIYPVGENGTIGHFAASANGTSGAYYHTNPSIGIIQSGFTSSNYAPLPNGAPFPITNMGTGINGVSSIEYWDIDGDNATPITLTWRESSDIESLTANKLSSLTIVGWDGSKWVRIPSTVDATSILNSPSSLMNGSITSNEPVIPNTYTVYTLGTLVDLPDLTPRISSLPNIVIGEATLEVLVTIIELNGTSTDGKITVRIPKSPLLTDFNWNSDQILATNNNLSVKNEQWNVDSESNPSYYIFSSTDVITGKSQTRFVFTVKFDSKGIEGKFPLGVIIVPNEGGGEENIINNQDHEQIKHFPN